MAVVNANSPFQMKRKQEEERLQKINQTNLIKEQARQNKENLRKQHMEKIKQEAEIVKKINKVSYILRIDPHGG